MIKYLTLNPRFCYIFAGVILFAAGLILGKFASYKKNREIRKDAVKRSRAVIGGQVAEQLAPLLPEFPCNLGDCRFVGKPVDFVVFSGMTEKNTVDEIVFVEVKTGNSALSGREKQVKDCITNGRVKYVEYRI